VKVTFRKVGFHGLFIWEHMTRQYGLVFSVLVHTLILLIPVSMIAKKHVQEIELFVAIEGAFKQQAPVRKKREIVKPPIKKETERQTVRQTPFQHLFTF
jgi:hypothetical protein